MISIEINAGGVFERMRARAGEATNRTQPNRQLATQLTGWTLRNFQSGGSQQTPSWAPLKDSTRNQKARLGYSSQPLLRTGHYRQSFRPFWTNDTAGTGSEVPYSKYLEGGTRHMVARPALPSERVALDYAVQIYGRWLERLAR